MKHLLWKGNEKDHMKKRMFFVFALILALGFSALDLHGDAARASDAQSIYDSVFRLHVIANSDTEEDQAAKLAVRDAVLEYERTRMADVKDAAEARERLMEDGAGLLATVEQTLAQCGMPYGATLEVGVFTFPERVYGDAVYPAGDYAALRISLGAGAGRNWWCVMFPPLCILELPGGEIDYEELRVNSLLLKLLKSIDGGKLWNTISEKLR